MLFHICVKIAKITRIPIGFLLLAFCFLGFFGNTESYDPIGLKIIVFCVWGAGYLFCWFAMRHYFWKKPKDIDKHFYD
jgi:tellurite resistance protein TehA-like permease